MTWEARVGRAVAWLAVAIAFAVAFVGIGGPFPDGHYASTSVIGTAAYNMQRWHTWLPVEVYVDHPPPPSTYYMHHPLGMFWVIAFLGRVFGLHDWVLRLPPLLYVTLTTWLLAKIGRELWGPLPGGLSALAYVALPITLGYANYHDLEQPVMFGTALATWGYLRYVRTWRERYAVASVLGFFWAANQDWAAYIWGAAFVGGLFVYLFLVPPRRRAELRDRPIARYWAFLCVAAAVALAGEFAVVMASTRISDVLTSYFVRSSGGDTPLRAVLEARRYRIELMFTGLAIALGKLAVPVIVWRAWRRESHLELLPCLCSSAPVVQYVAFKEGADIHIFWPHYFASYFALAVGALVASAGDLGVGSRDGWRAPRPNAGALGGVDRGCPRRVAGAVRVEGRALPGASRTRDGRPVCRGEPRHRPRQRGGIALVPGPNAAQRRRGLPRRRSRRLGAAVGVAPAPVGRESAGRRAVSDATRVYIMDTRLASAPEIREAATKYHVHAVGYLWVFDRRRRPPRWTGMRWTNASPRCGRHLARRDRTDPQRARDPWVTWEGRTMVGQPTAAPAAPVSRPINSGSHIMPRCDGATARLRRATGKSWRRASTDT